MSLSTLPPAVIDYYTDVLCVWAWIAQPRLEKLQQQWGQQVEIRHRYVDVFGDSHNKITQRWGQQDGFDKFNAHIVASAKPFRDTPVHPDTWKRVRPCSSMPAHLFLKAVGIVAGDNVVPTMAALVRHAFFVDARNISRLTGLLELAEGHNLDVKKLESCLRDGSAMAQLSSDQHNAHDLGVKGSPTWVLNEGRQILYGNVGYRILNANIEELIRTPGTEASWC